MDLYQPLLSDLIATQDNLRHRILFEYSTYDYVVPCEIFIEPDRRAIAIVAYTTHRLPGYHMRAATAIAAWSCPHDLPIVMVDEPTRRVLSIFLIAVQDIADERLLDLAVTSTVRRLMAVARRIDLCADGLSIETVIAIDETELLRGLVPLRSYRPFKKAE